MPNRPATKRISHLLLLMITAILAGFLLVLGVLFFRLDLKGIYIKEYLYTAQQLKDFAKVNGTTFEFDRIEFNYYDLGAQQERLFKVSLMQYQQIIELLTPSSYLSVNDLLVSKFIQENPATLTIFVRDENGSSYSYQKIEFLNNSDYFRIEVPGKAGPFIWEYYRYPRAYDKIIEILSAP